MLQNELVTLRLVEEADLALLVKWRNSRRVWRGFFNRFPLSLSAQHDWYHGLLQSTTRKLFIICAAVDGGAIGAIGLDEIDFANRAAELGNMLIGEEAYLGKGYARAALGLLLAYCFQRLNLHRLYLRVYAHNEPAIGLYRRCGFQPEGVMRQAIFDEGQYRDVLLMSLLAPEYVESP
jgi:RimJ/RimL family protein N-acetyltransferase